MTPTIRTLACLAFASALPALASADCTLPVRTPSSDFMLSDAGWAIHRPTGLMWARCGLGAVYMPQGNRCGAYLGHSWQTALNAVQLINDGQGQAGFNDWRLPTVKELASLVSPCGLDLPAINSEVFPFPANLPQPMFWSSTPILSPTSQPAFAYVVEFGGGAVYENRIEQSRYVRLVRNAAETP